MSDIKLNTLLKFHKFIGSLICEEMGHSWRQVTFEDTINTAPLGKCQRCGDTRMDWNVSTSSNSGISITPSESYEVTTSD